MKLFATLMAGIFIGASIAVLTAPIVPAKTDCSVYRVDSRAVTSYVLKPPPAEVIYKACPQTTEKVCVSPKPENVTQGDLTNTSDTQVNEKPKNEHEPRRHRRHRVRRYWR